MVSIIEGFHCTETVTILNASNLWQTTFISDKYKCIKWRVPNYIDFSLHTHDHVSTDEVNIFSSAVNKAKQLGVQFIDPVETIMCDTHGCDYYNTRHDVEVRIPEAAILPNDGMIKIEFGVAMYGPFKITDGAGVKRVSPIVWLELF